MRALLLLAGVFAARGGPSKDDCDFIEVKDGGSFEIGGPRSGYADGKKKCWELKAREKVSIVFEFFETEYLHDYLYLYDGESDLPARSLSGELPCPYVWRSEEATVYAVFEADASYHANPRTQQLGFKATWIDSSDGNCANDCSGATKDWGDCVDGLCECDKGHGGGDCSLEVAALTPGEALAIDGVAPGEWSYSSFTFTEDASFAVELVDRGAADSDPRLMVGRDLPSLSHYDFTDWFAWYYDSSDVHYIRSEAKANKGETIYVGVLNDKTRAKSDVKADVTLRLAAPGETPCLEDCNGHGTCNKASGECSCEDDWEGSVANRPNACEYAIEDLELDKTYSKTLRIGDWDFYRFRPADAGGLFVALVSSTPASYPVLLARKGAPPLLESGWLPSLDTFVYDLADEEGYTKARGQRMDVFLNASMLAGGEDWYVGVFNLWGAGDDAEGTSRAACDYALTASLYRAGTPCPSTDRGFCDGYSCDFNSGSCACPRDRLWRDCSLEAVELVPGKPAMEHYLAPGASAYFHVAVDAELVRSGKNLVVTLEVEKGSGAARPQLRAVFEDIPFPGAVSEYSDHDLLANFYGDAESSILLDAEELAAAGPGAWYFGVVADGADGSGQLAYSMKAETSAKLSCPTARASKLPCDGHGTCKTSLGRCDCDPGNALDDCSADGVFALGGEEPARAPEIAPDDWVYYSAVVGCSDRVLDVKLDSSSDGAIPKLFLRRGRLPLMVEETFDANDFYGPEDPTQRIVLAGCTDATYGCNPSETPGGCCARQTFPGTAYATGAPEPGVWYIGVYNDASATAPLTDYVVTARVLSSDAADRDEKCEFCADGFLGPDCELPCPGVAPEDVYSNSPVEGDSCNGRGACELLHWDGWPDDPDAPEQYRTACACEGAVGDECELECPTDDGGTPCSGLGDCRFDKHGGAKCACDAGRAGEACEKSCPVADGAPCSGRGVCVEREDFTGDASARCECQGPYTGIACQQACPLDAASVACGGRGACVASDDSGTAALCACDHGYGGDACESSDKDRDRRPALAALITGFVAIAACACVACIIAARRQRTIARYERVLHEAGRLENVDVEYEAPDTAFSFEMKDRGERDNTSSPFHDPSEPGTEI